MINLILLFPLIACLILWIFKKGFLNNLMLNLYAIIHFVASVGFCMGKDLLPFWKPCSFFSVNSKNLLFLAVMSIVFFAVAIYNNGYIKKETDVRKVRHYTYMVLFFVLSMTGAILSTNLGAAWVFIEGTTLASAYLIYFHKTKHSIEAAWKYVFICSIGIALAFVGIILLTIATGNLNSLYYSDLYNNAALFNPFWLKLSFVFILFGIGTKMGLAPVHFWLPDAHAEAPSPISALLSATLLNSAFLIILNVFGIMVAAGADSYARIMMLAMGFLSLFVTAVFVYHINNYKRMLAYSSIENMGVLIIGAALGGIALIASMIHLVGHSLVKASFFLTSGNILELYGTKKIKSVTGLLKTDKTTGWLWILSFVGIAALPPSLLFISEFMIIKTFIEQNKIFLCIVFLILLTIVLYGLAKAVLRMAFSSPSEEIQPKKLSWTMYAPQIVMLLFVFICCLSCPTQIVKLITIAVG
jgi:hydrogenase-4 component F